MGVYLPYIPKLPSEYQEVEYIQSSGTQYINTGFTPSNTTKIQISMGGWTYVQQYAHLFGVRAAWSTTDASIGRGFFLCHQYNSSYIGMFGIGYSNNTGWSSTTFSFANGNNHIVEMSQSGAYEDGTLKASLQTVTFTSPSNMCIFALNDNGTVKENSSYKLYYFKIRDNGTLVRDFVPCYRKSDGVIGLYDLVNSAFYTNSGTGTFSKGNDVTMVEMKNAYIGEVKTETYTFSSGYHAEGSPTEIKDITKSGYKIMQICFEGQATSNEAYSGIYPGLNKGSDTGDMTWYALDYGSSAILLSNIRYRANGTRYDEYIMPTSGISRTFNTFKYTLSRTGWSVVINGNSYSGTYSSGMLSIITSVMDNANCSARLYGNKATVMYMKATVLYEPNS